MSAPDFMLELEALIDPARLAAAWRIARERPPAAGAEAAAVDPTPVVPSGDAPGGAGTDDLDDAAPDDAAPDDAVLDDTAPEVEPAEEGEPARAAPLPVALAHRQLQGELERTLAASPGLGAKARRVLAVPLAQLAAVIATADQRSEELGGSAPRGIDLAAAEAALDQLEDVLQALLSEAGWPESPESED